MKKQELRNKIKALRKSLTKQQILKKSDIIYNKLFELKEINSAKTVMVYISSFNEVRTDKIIKKLLDGGKKVCAPITDKKTKTIRAYYFDSTDDFVKGAYGILEPPRIFAADVSQIDVAIIPGVAFDKCGNRMGFGEGYYDRFLSQFKGTKIGIGYKFQCEYNIECDEYDIPMDYIINEEEIYVI